MKVLLIPLLTAKLRSARKILVCALALAYGLPCLAESATPDSSSERPNILFILIDDMGWKDVAYAGSTYYQTPHIDGLAEDGMRFKNAYSPAPVCTPSRSAIFSGKNPARTKLTTPFRGPSGPDDRLHERSKYRGGRDQFFEGRHRRVLPSDEVTFAQALAEGGYSTGFFGKWHIGECPGYYPDERGFQVAKGYRLQQMGSRSHWMKQFAPNAANLDDADQDAYVAEVLTDECVRFITDRRDGPWLAVLSHYLLHSPVEPKPDKLARYRGIPTTDQNNPGYAAMVESVDDSVGKLLATLEQLDLEENTLVIFTSDNGGFTRFTSNYPLMGGKSFPFEAGMKVPFIAKWPGRIEAGISSDLRIIGTDLYPTMIAAAGLPLRPGQHVDARNLLPLLTRSGPVEKDPLIFHYPHYTHATGPFSAMIEDDWKLIRFYNDAHGAHLLYHLGEDPEEQHDLSARHPDRCERMDRRLGALLREMDAEMPSPNPRFKPKARGAQKNRKFTLNFALRERARLEKRIKNSQKENEPTK